MATITSPRPQSPSKSIRTDSPSIPSGNNTPTSSVRLSMELPNTNSQAHSGNPATAQRRNRAALRDYYHLKSKPATSPARPQGLSRTASITSTASDSTVTSAATLTTNEPTTSNLMAQLDDPSFDADKYIADLLKTSTLREILRTESTLVSEIRNLDGERKALVYDNYSKLIKAVGTIGDMQKGIQDRGSGKLGLDGVKGLESKLDSMMATVNEIKGSQSGTSRANIEQTKKARQARKQQDLVKWVLSAPQRLDSMIEQGEVQKAENEWRKVQELLNKWQGVKGVDEVAKACETVMKKLTEEDATRTATSE